ncbi:uncharacterized protein MYCFIDRAFT_173954 [Pseudocercospora fijiensis CIRAD86]|uniref:Uncharacterized protein n=1 Tax=Pseudocercospora fijiensis (strain CIRAD86) TaxID=383855 RepID=M3AKH9_PSEFD|nr:uncharacterized protein MYCFIDRAFT_173954 [Pseudocercospora fijiensis CIRAD86]EME85091.1 hypothetical protein MYCFIDRAFT_173954 [Pseudocercospora fijiensis CIRAD86]
MVDMVSLCFVWKENARYDRYAGFACKVRRQVLRMFLYRTSTTLVSVRLRERLFLLVRLWFHVRPEHLCVGGPGLPRLGIRCCPRHLQSAVGHGMVAFSLQQVSTIHNLFSGLKNIISVIPFLSLASVPIHPRQRALGNKMFRQLGQGMKSLHSTHLASQSLPSSAQPQVNSARNSTISSNRSDSRSGSEVPRQPQVTSSGRSIVSRASPRSRSQPFNEPVEWRRTGRETRSTSSDAGPDTPSGSSPTTSFPSEIGPGSPSEASPTDHSENDAIPSSITHPTTPSETRTTSSEAAEDTERRILMEWEMRNFRHNEGISAQVPRHLPQPLKQLLRRARKRDKKAAMSKIVEASFQMMQLQLVCTFVGSINMARPWTEEPHGRILSHSRPQIGNAPTPNREGGDKSAHPKRSEAKPISRK